MRPAHWGASSFPPSSFLFLSTNKSKLFSTHTHTQHTHNNKMSGRGKGGKGSKGGAKRHRKVLRTTSRHQQARYPQAARRGGVAHLRPHLRGDPRCPQGVRTSSAMRHVHRARPPQDRHGHGRRLRSQAPGRTSTASAAKRCATLECRHRHKPSSYSSFVK